MKAKRGQIFIIIVVILLLLVVLFAVLPMLEARSKSAPVVQQVSWQVGGQNVTFGSVGQEIKVSLVIRCTEAYVGSIVFKVRKDFAYWFDRDYAVRTFPVNLKAGQATELGLSFVPDEASHGRFRGYFVETDFSVRGTSWVMDDSYPPRLEVVELGQEPNVPA